LPCATIFKESYLAVTDFCDIRKLLLDLKRMEENLMEQTGLSLNEALCLCGTSKGVCEPGKLAKEMEISPSRLSRILDSLAKRGLIDRAISTEDRRNILLTLSHEGTTMVATVQCTGLEIPDHLAVALDSFHDDLMEQEETL